MIILFALIFILPCCAALRFTDLLSNEITFNLRGNSSTCLKDLSSILDASLRGEEWALRDTWGDVPAGVNEGRNIDFGHFDQCIDARSDQFKPIYCLVPLSGLGLEFQSAVCLPETCSKEMIQDIVNSLLGDSRFKSEMPIERCTDSREKEFGTLEHCCIIVGGVIVVLVLVSTAYHAYYFKGKGPAFSMIRNIARLDDLTPNRPEDVSCLNGIRVISTFWVVMLHAFYYFAALSTSMYSRADHANLRTKLWHELFVQGRISADTFFVISGFCVSYGYMRSHKRREFKVLDYYFHRYMRLTPTKIFTMVVMIFIGYVKYGPVVDPNYWYGSDAENCRVYWWSALLYVQNYVNPSNMCVSISWSMDVDFHLFLLSPLLLTAFVKYGYSLVPFLCSLMAISNYYIYLVVMNVDTSNYPDYVSKVYVPTHTRFSTWLLGFILGYIVYRRKNVPNPTGRLSLILNLATWTILFGIILFILVGPWRFRDSSTSADAGAIFHPLHRFIWGLAICGIIYNCARGRGGPVDYILSLPIWKPLVRINYAIYLLNKPLILLAARLLRQEFHANGFLMLQTALGIYLMTVLFAIPVTLFIEMPFMNLEIDWKRRQFKKKME